MKALYEYFKDDLGEAEPGPTPSAVELAEFQEDAVKKARRILARYNGVMIADSVGLDASVLGEEVHPQTFNTLKRIRGEDQSVIEEEEQFTELVSSEGLLQQLRAFLDAGGREALERLRPSLRPPSWAPRISLHGFDN